MICISSIQVNSDTPVQPGRKDHSTLIITLVQVGTIQQQDDPAPIDRARQPQRAARLETTAGAPVRNHPVENTGYINHKGRPGAAAPVQQE